MTGVLHIVVAMKPLDGNFAENALKHGVAGINVDGCRVRGVRGNGVWGTSNKTINTDRKFNASPAMQDYRSKPVETEDGKIGRWPANVILGHFSEGCRMIGTKRVKGITGGTGNHDGSVYGKRTNQGEPVKDYADSDGKETVEAWDCVDGCPIAEMDKQSGMLKSGRDCVRTKSGMGYHGNIGKAGDEQISYGDSGGASRFFKQIGECNE